MDIFNFFIVPAEILALLFFGWVMTYRPRNNRMFAVIAGDPFMMLWRR